MHIRFIGSGDAFGSGGRFHTCIHVATAATDMLVDLGASAFHGLKASGLDLNRIGAILLTHFHGDHFGGLPYFILDAHYVSNRKAPLLIAGPPGVEAAVLRLLEACYPGFMQAPRVYEIRFVEIAAAVPAEIAGATVTARPVKHDPNLACCYGYRIAADGVTFVYSGDTTWTDTLIPLAQGADLFAVECYTRARPMAVHMDYATLAAKLPEIGARRVVLTHMSRDMLDHPEDIRHEMAHDGLTIEIGTALP